MNELSGIIDCTPAPFGSSFSLTVKLSEDIAVTSYSFPVSPETGDVPALSVKKEIKSPTDASDAGSASSNADILKWGLAVYCSAGSIDQK